MTMTIELPDEQAEALDALSRRESRPVEQIVRDALSAHLESRATQPKKSVMDDPAFRSAFGAWKGLLDEDGTEYQDRLRAEWDHRP